MTTDDQQTGQQRSIVRGVYDNIRAPFGGVFRFTFLSSPARTAVMSFALVAVLGAFLLMLPVSSRTGEVTSPVDCLFTSVSAVCVTGLLVRSTPDHWSLFGQLVILVLIQMGGLGIMTLGAFVASVLRKGMSMRFERFMKTLVESQVEDNILWLVGFICLFTFIAEAIGATALYLSWQGAKVNGVAVFESNWECLYHSVFHSISAFCNAGFSLNNESLAEFSGWFNVTFIVCLLIVVGGLGFTVVRDVETYVRWWFFKRRGKRPRLSTHTRLVLVMTGALLVVGFVVVLIVEPSHSLQGTDAKTKLCVAMFHSVTPRTAGFNTVDMAKLGAPTVFMTIVFMIIGGSPGGTAGGVKTSTVGIMFASVIATLRGREKAEMFHHSISEETVHRVASIILLSLVVLGSGIFVLLLTESGTQLVGSGGPARFEHIVFEAASAFGTVGLSRGLTGPDCEVTTFGRIVITALMFVGRLGPVALILSVATVRDTTPYNYPEDRVLVG